MSEPLLGEVRIFAGNFEPMGWAYCAGQILAITQNTALFSLLGTTYGGNGVNTFALPDLRGRCPVGSGGGAGIGLTERILGEQGGEEIHTLSQNEMPAHAHPAQAAATPGNTNDPSGALPAIAETGRPYSDSAANVPMGADSSTASGGSQPHNNMHPYLGVSYIIALQGIFPSRS